MIDYGAFSLYGAKMITNPNLVKFSAEKMRRAADLLESACLTSEYLVSIATNQGIKAELEAIADKSEVIDDKAIEEGRPVYTVQYILNYLANMENLLMQLNTPDVNGVTMRQQIQYMATNPRNPLLS